MTNDIRKKFAKRLSDLLDHRHLSQKEFAEKLGVSTATVSDWVHGVKYPRIDKMQKMADLLRVPMNQLMHDQEDERTENSLSSALADKLSRLSPEEQLRAMAYIDGMLANRQD